MWQEGNGNGTFLRKSGGLESMYGSQMSVCHCLSFYRFGRPACSWRLTCPAHWYQEAGRPTPLTQNQLTSGTAMACHVKSKAHWRDLVFSQITTHTTTFCPNSFWMIVFWVQGANHFMPRVSAPMCERLGGMWNPWQHKCTCTDTDRPRKQLLFWILVLACCDWRQNIRKAEVLAAVGPHLHFLPLSACLIWLSWRRRLSAGRRGKGESRGGHWSDPLGVEV